MLRRIALLLGLGALVFIAPSLWLIATTPISTPEDSAPAEAALIFGALVRGGTISPLHRERLEAGITLFETGKVQRLVASNAPEAARAMRAYLVGRGVPETAIELDTRAIRTPDTCWSEKNRAEPRRVLFVSQRFHLPRVTLHCARYGLDAQPVAADDPNRPVAPIATRARVRSYRFLREALLTWGALLGLYPTH